jgi:hypothetical protein
MRTQKRIRVARKEQEMSSQVKRGQEVLSEVIKGKDMSGH